VNWSPPPERITWTLPKPIASEKEGAAYDTVTLHAPTVAEVIIAAGRQAERGGDTTLRLIAAVNEEGIPYEALRRLPIWLIEQMSVYLAAFIGAPLPGVASEWRRLKGTDVRE
jgi:hypothetical protein